MVKSIIEEMGLTSTTGMKMSTYNKVVERLVEICTAHKAELEAEECTKNDGAAGRIKPPAEKEGEGMPWISVHQEVDGTKLRRLAYRAIGVQV